MRHPAMMSKQTEQLQCTVATGFKVGYPMVLPSNNLSIDPPIFQKRSVSCPRSCKLVNVRIRTKAEIY